MGIVRKCRQLFISAEEFLPPKREISADSTENNEQSPQTPCKCCQGGKSGLATWCITYDTHDQYERQNFELMLRGPDAFIAIEELRRYLRQEYKHGDHEGAAYKLLERIRDELYRACEDLPEMM